MGRNVEREEGNGLKPLSPSAGGPTSPLATFTQSIFPAAAFGTLFRRALGPNRAWASSDITGHSAFLCGLGFKFGMNFAQ